MTVLSFPWYPAALELHKIYCVLPDDDAAADGDLRVIHESGEDYLYSQDRFVPIEVPPAIKRSLARNAGSAPLARERVEKRPRRAVGQEPARFALQARPTK